MGPASAHPPRYCRPLLGYPWLVKTASACLWLSAVLAGSWSAAPAGAQQRTIVPITNSAEEHVSAVVSPSGGYVAFKGADKLAVVGYGGGNETVLAAGLNLGTFVWAPDSTGLYFMDGPDLKFARVSGGQATIVQRLPETNHILCDIKDDGVLLYGVWFFVRTSGTPVREWQVFSMRTDGSAPPTVLLRSVLTIDGVRLSPDETAMVYREYDPTPFQPIDLVIATATGGNRQSLTNNQGLQLSVGYPWWDGDGSAILFPRTDLAISRQVVERLTIGTQTITSLTFPTRARNISVAPSGDWILYEGYWQAGQVWTPVLMPVRGGGHVFLDTSRPVLFRGTPHLDRAVGNRVVFSGDLAGANTSQVLKVELAREMRIEPRIEIGQTFQIALPVEASEIGAVFLAAGIAATPVSMPGLAGSFGLDLGNLVTVLVGVGDGQSPLRTQIAVPNVNFLVRKALYAQAVRFMDLTPRGDFTRWVELPIF